MTNPPRARVGQPEQKSSFEGPQVKRHKPGSSSKQADPAQTAPGLKVHFHSSIPHITARLKVWQPELAALGVTIWKTLSQDVTHVIVEGSGGTRALPALSCRGPGATSPLLVDLAWVQRCLKHRQLLPTSGFEVTVPKPSASGREAHEGPQGMHSRYAKWLGWWDANLAQATHVHEVVLQADYSTQRSVELGNERIVQLLAEISKYERALTPDSADPDNLSHEALRYAEVAAAVRACSFPLTPGTPRHHLEAQLPFCGSFMAEVVRQLVDTGTCPQLEAFRADQAVKDSQGLVRQGTEGGRTRQLLRRIPGLGHVAAVRLYEAGVRTLEELAELTAKADPRVEAAGLTREARWCLAHWEDLLQDVPPEEVAEMKQAVAAGLKAVAGDRTWQVMEVGGARRGKPGHDVDLLVSPLSGDAGGVVHALLDHLVSQGRMVARGEGFLKVQAGKCPEELPALRDALCNAGKNQHHIADKYDHIWGVYITQGGHYRRLDIMFVPRSQLPFALVGWTGSRQYLRWLKKHCADRNMMLNSHCLLRRTAAGWKLVPQEVPGLARDGRTDYLPPGWRVGRALQSEADILRLIQLPCRPPAARNCP